MAKVLITGGTGFIGRQVTKELLNRGYEVFSISKNTVQAASVSLHPIRLDLLSLSDVSAFFKEFQFDNLLHMAWYVGPKCHGANINIDWLAASLHLIKCFCEAGGRKLLCNGTVSEYDFSYGYLQEDMTPLANKSLHGQSKASLYNVISRYASQNNIEFKWPRIFNLYGPPETPQRLMPSVINACLRGEDVKVSDCLKFQDYLHVEDTARGIVDVFEKDISGAVNICSGKPVQLREIVTKIAELTGFNGEILWGAVPAAFGDDLVVGNNEKLKSIGWKPKYSLEEGLKMTIDWWRKNNV